VFDFSIAPNGAVTIERVQFNGQSAQDGYFIDGDYSLLL